MEHVLIKMSAFFLNSEKFMLFHLMNTLHSVLSWSINIHINGFLIHDMIYERNLAKNTKLVNKIYEILKAYLPCLP